MIMSPFSKMSLHDRNWENIDLEKSPSRFANIQSHKRPSKCWSADRPENKPSLALKGMFEGLTSSTSTLTTEGSHEVKHIRLPWKKYNRLYRNLRWTIFSVYRRLNILTIAVNIIVLVTLATTKQFQYDKIQILATAVAVNLLTAVLVRQEIVINLLFIIFGMCPTWLPLRVRRLAAKIYHLGGVHSGAAIAATIWYAVLSGFIFDTFLSSEIDRLGVAILTITLVLDILLIGIIGFSHPKLRTRYHNAWEAIHRYAGWTSVALFWAHFGILLHVQRLKSTTNANAVEMLAKSPVFWCLTMVTISLVLPWLRLRKVDVHAQPLSSHAVRLHFTYTNLPLCAAPRLSNSPLMEWHAFAGIPEENGIGFSVLVSKAGDWTARMIQSPPTKIWVRGIPVRGVLHIAPIFNKIVLVATGSGIGPVLSLLYARQIPCRIVWSTPDPLKTYQQSIIDQINLSDPEAVVINTTKTGRPDLVLEAYRLYKTSKAEAVFIISNPKVTRKVVYGLESRGVPIFAPIFDS